MSEQVSTRHYGGIWALAGYLYQIVGTLDITARLSSVPHRLGTDSDEVLVALKDVGGYFEEAQHERGGEDALLCFRKLELTDADCCVLLQFKCSVTDAKLGGRELKKIITKLDGSAKDLSRRGQKVTACVIVTNREFTGGRRGTAEEVWLAETSQTRKYQLRRILGYSVEDSRSALRKFARQYGVLDDEVDEGIHRLIGEVICDTIGGAQDSSITKWTLLEAFTGSCGARLLTAKSVAKESQQELDWFCEGIALANQPWNGDLVERAVFESVDEAIRQRALVGLYGPGGCGKSALLWQLLSRVQAAGCCTVRSASNLQRSWVQDSVSKWRNLPKSGDTIDKAMRRLKIANPGKRPVLWLALDGLDEGDQSADRKSHIRDVLRWFWDRDCLRNSNPPEATLIVTCREKDDLCKIWLDIPPSDFRSAGPPLTIPIGDFSQRELLDAIRKRFPVLYPSIRTRMLRENSVRPTLGSDYDTAVFGQSSSDAESVPIEGEVLSSLKHPVMWLALLSMEPSAQESVLSGETQSICELAHQFVKWFHWKLGLRDQQRFRDLSEPDLLQVLGAIARRSGEARSHSRDYDWCMPARQTGRLNQAEAVALYGEAFSSGLIVKDARLEWRWRHSIVCDYLKNTPVLG